MKKFIAILLLVTTLSACESETKYGQCVSISEEDEKPDLVYRVSVWNIVLGFVFSETIIVPIIVLVAETYCPVDRK